MANSLRKILIRSAINDPSLGLALLPDETPITIGNLFKYLPKVIINECMNFLNQNDASDLLDCLTKLTDLVSSRHWLVGNALSIADISIAAQLSLLQFPESAGRKLSGKGCPGFSDHPELKRLFEWRDQLEAELMETDLEKV